MKEKQLFPCDTAHFARMILREYEEESLYVIQSNYNKETKTYDSELYIPVSSPTAELEAWNAYIGALDTAVNRILRERSAVKKFFAELAEKTANVIKPKVFEFRQMWDERRNKYEEMLR